MPINFLGTELWYLKTGFVLFCFVLFCFFFEREREYKQVKLNTKEIHTGKKKSDIYIYIYVRTNFDLDPTQEWIQAHVAQTMNL